MTATKTFHIGDVISITDGRLVSPDGMSGVIEILSWMTGEQLTTIGLLVVASECSTYLREQFPELADVVIPDWVDSDETATAFLATLSSRLGEHVEVTRTPRAEARSFREEAA